MERSITLNGNWKLYYYDAIRGETHTEAELAQLPHIAAQVPGNVELDLSRAGLLPENLLKGMGTKIAEQYETYEWWYQRTFAAPERSADERVYLYFDGVDCLAEYYLNGQRLGASDNMFTPQEFDVTDQLIAGDNRLSVRLRSALLAELQGKPDALQLTNWDMGDGRFQRKPAHSFGWDILPRALTAGLWKDVELRIRDAYGFEELGYVVKFDQQMSPCLEVYFSVTAPMEKLVGETLRVRIHGTCGEDSSFDGEKRFYRRRYARIQCPIRNPKLWWPYGYGEAAVYDMTAQLLDGDRVVATRTMPVGLRRIRLDYTESMTEENARFRFEVNGVPIMCRGSNWIPLAPYHSMDKERYAPAMALVSDIGCNMLRIWGGGVYEQDDFYDYCDRHGVLVWQDFMMACRPVPTDDGMWHNLEEEFSYQIRRLRHHPCLALWSGDNEIDESMKDTGIDPARNRVTRELLPRLIAQYDGQRPFLPSSPYISSRCFAEWQNGRYTPTEQHLWGVRDYYKSDFYARSPACFVSETGYQGCPCPESMRRTVDEDYLWPNMNEQWIWHSAEQWGGDGWIIRAMNNQIRQLFGSVPDTLEEYALASQISQAEAFKFFIERIRIQKPRTGGILWWNLLDGWPVVSNGAVDFFFRKKLCYFAIKRAQAPFAILLGEINDSSHRVVATNDTLQPVSGHYTVSDLDTDEVLAQGDFTVDANTNRTLGGVYGNYGDKRMLLIHWVVDGKDYYNHYLDGHPYFSLEQCSRWMEKLSRIAGDEDVGLTWL